MTKALKKITALFIALILVIPTGFYFNLPEAKAQPFVPVHDALLHAMISGQMIALNTTNLQTAVATGAIASKEVGPVPGIIPTDPGTAFGVSVLSIDFWARKITNLFIQQIVDDIVGWIDGGFAGQPAFLQDPADFFLDTGDAIFGDFIDGTELGFLCDPFEADIEFILNYRYQSDFEEQVHCRLSDIISNTENFLAFTREKDFIGYGGWNSWFDLTRRQNNPYGSYIQAEAELSARIRGRQNLDLIQLNWGSGFLSWQECSDPPSEEYPDPSQKPLSECLNKGPVKTPGSVIERGLGDVIGADLTDLQLADGFDRILDVLLNQLVNKALGSTGLVG